MGLLPLRMMIPCPFCYVRTQLEVLSMGQITNPHETLGLHVTWGLDLGLATSRPETLTFINYKAPGLSYSFK